MPEPTLRIQFRTYCYGCRRGWGKPGDTWHRAYATSGGHRWSWEYWLHCGGRRLLQRQGFATFDRAWESARRSYIKLASTACLASSAVTL